MPQNQASIGQSDDLLEEIPARRVSEMFSLTMDEKLDEYPAWVEPRNRVHFKNALVTGRLNIKLNDEACTYLFSDCTFPESVEVSTSETTIVELYFYGCTFKKGINFLGNFKGPILFEECNCSSLNLYGELFQDMIISLTGGAIYIAPNAKFGLVQIGGFNEDYCCIDQIRMDLGGSTGEIRVVHTNVQVLIVSGMTTKEIDLVICNCHILQFELDSVLNHGNIEINKVKPLNHTHRLTTNHSAISNGPQDSPFLRELNPGGGTLFSIVRSMLTGVKLVNIDFSEFKTVYIEESGLSDIQIYNVIWPKHIEVDSSFIKFFESREEFEKPPENPILLARENYRQLKYACSKHHDYIGEQFFHGLEMKWYDKSLNWHKHFWTKLILKLSLWTSNFGQSIIRPLLSIVFVNGLLFYLLHLTGDGPFKGYDFTKGENYVNTAAEFIRFVNPLHKNDPELIGWAFIIDVLIRICSSYFIYSLIRATRRFVR